MLCNYFKDNWFCENWRDSWTDLHRIGREGLYNTNNLTETWFRSWGQFNYNKRNRRLVTTLIQKLISSFKHSELQLFQFQKGLLKVPQLNFQFKFTQLLNLAKEIVKSKLVSQFVYTTAYESQ